MAISNNKQKIHPKSQVPFVCRKRSQIENSSDVHASIDNQLAGIIKNFKVPVKIKKNSKQDFDKLFDLDIPVEDLKIN